LYDVLPRRETHYLNAILIASPRKVSVLIDFEECLGVATQQPIKVSEIDLNIEVARKLPPHANTGPSADCLWSKTENCSLDAIGCQKEGIILRHASPNNRRGNGPLVQVQNGAVKAIALGVGACRHSDENQGGNNRECASCGFNSGANNMDLGFHVVISFPISGCSQVYFSKSTGI